MERKQNLTWHSGLLSEMGKRDAGLADGVTARWEGRCGEELGGRGGAEGGVFAGWLQCLGSEPPCLMGKPALIPYLLMDSVLLQSLSLSFRSRTGNCM